MARSWLIDSRGFANKVRNATLPSAHQIKDCGAFRECPNCHHWIDNKDAFPEWPGLPAGVKFDPSDTELLEHLAAKCGVESSKPHSFINEFIPTLEGDEGICYTHPENLPGAVKDGNSVHFFHRIIKAYATGQRKRRKINHRNLVQEHVRWHKTGKTKPVMENGILKGFKKIMVLYVSSKNGSKPNKSNWVMHQYHLGSEEEEREGEYVVSKIFYQQPKKIGKTEILMLEDTDNVTAQTSPRTPKTYPPNPPRSGTSAPCDAAIEDDLPPLPAQDMECRTKGLHAPPTDNAVGDDVGDRAWLAGESQAVESSDWACLDDLLLCSENIDSSAPLYEPALDLIAFNTFGCIAKEVNRTNVSCGIADLENLEMDSPPDFQLSNLQFSSQDSVFDWIDKL